MAVKLPTNLENKILYVKYDNMITKHYHNCSRWELEIDLNGL